jgi:site-specific DNA recombinase
VLLAEELSRGGVELVFLPAPSGTTPEDRLLVQFQGLIAEYERAQIAERSRRGKRHRAQQGSINVLSGAPYGYRYMRKSDTAAAYYEVIESEAGVVRRVYEVYTQQGLSINAIARLLNEEHIPTRTETTRWERSTVWGILRNPAYRGRACFGKTELRPRQRITRRLRKRQGLASRDSANHERPRQDWIEIPVPALISEETFALAQEQLEQNRRHSPRRTLEPSLLQGMLVCERYGYALYRTSTRTSARKLGIPSVLDRFIQRAVMQVLQSRWDRTFSEHSYGFRPGRSAHQAVAAAQQYITAGYRWVVDLDLEKFSTGSITTN